MKKRKYEISSKEDKKKIPKKSLKVEIGVRLRDRQRWIGITVDVPESNFIKDSEIEEVIHDEILPYLKLVIKPVQKSFEEKKKPYFYRFISEALGILKRWDSE